MARRRDELQRLFTTFPGGWPGVGLLLLRLIVGGTATVQGAAYLSEAHNGEEVSTWIVGLMALLSGTSLVVGFVTPAAGAIVGLGSLALALSWLPGCRLNLLETKISTIFAVATATALLFLGPGAFSMDARLFGRREIFIPRSLRPPES